jgi:hypothetical protein
MTGRRILLALAALVVLVTATASPTPTPAAAGEPEPAVERVLVFMLPAVSWADVSGADLPNLRPFLQDAAVADMSVRGVSRSTSATDGYATVGAGTRARGASSGGSAYEPGEIVDGVPVEEEFARRTGIVPPPDSIVDLGIVQIIGTNRALDYGAEPGAMGTALAAAGLQSAVISNGDRPVQGVLERQAPAALAAMDGDGLVPAGALGPDLLVENPDAPYGIELDNEAVATEFRAVWEQRGAAVVEASDLVRWDDYRGLTTSTQRAQLLDDALRSSDELFGMLLEEVDPERDAVLLVGPYHRSGTAHLTVAALRAPGVEPGLLRSGQTRRSGFVTLADVAPTVLELLGVERPESMEGRPWTVGDKGGDLSDRLHFLIDADRAAHFRDEHVAPASTWYVVAQALLWILAAVTLHWGRPWQRRAVEVLALAGITFLPATHLATLFPFEEWGSGWWWLFLAGTSLGLAYIGWRAGRRRITDGLLVTLSMVVGLLTVDVLLGAPLQLNAVFGYSPTIAGRFAGYGNLAFAQLAAASIILACLLAYRIGGRRGLVAAVVVLLGAIVLDGAPFWGSDVGGVLALVPAACVALWMLSERKVRLRTVFAWGAGAVVAVLAFGFLDLMRPEASQSHLGRLLGDIGNDGFQPFRDVVIRKLDANLGVLTSSVWTLMVPVVIAFVGYLFWRAPGELRRIRTHVPTERAALAGLLVVMFLGFALNDSGIAVPGVMLGVLNASLVYLLMRTADQPEPPGGERDDEGVRPVDAAEPAAADRERVETVS